ncbi:MAG: hypothetical protein ACFCGT_24405 [Sandaracinaceae bacterium]
MLSADLARLGAPDALVALAEAEDEEDVWAAVDRPGHRAWVAACLGMPVDRLLHAVAGVVDEGIARGGGGPPPLRRATRLARSRAAATDLLAAAEACEALTEEGAGTYRAGEGPPVQAAARAAARVARAAEGLEVAEARFEAARLERARQVGAFAGIGTSAALPAHPGPPRLDPAHAATDPGHAMLQAVVATLAEATEELVTAIAGVEPAPEARRAARLRVDQALRHHLDGARSSARGG